MRNFYGRDRCYRGQPFLGGNVSGQVSCTLFHSAIQGYDRGVIHEGPRLRRRSVVTLLFAFKIGARP